MQVLTTNIIPDDITETLAINLESKITFSSKDIIGIFLHNNEIMGITVQYDDWDIKRVLIDSGSSKSVLF